MERERVPNRIKFANELRSKASYSVHDEQAIPEHNSLSRRSSDAHDLIRTKQARKRGLHPARKRHRTVLYVQVHLNTCLPGPGRPTGKRADGKEGELPETMMVYIYTYTFRHEERRTDSQTLALYPFLFFPARIPPPSTPLHILFLLQNQPNRYPPVTYRKPSLSLSPSLDF